MADSWRLARSLQTLEAEIKSRWPDTTVWDIGDADHRDSYSDHNPNSRGVVCAIDVLDDGGMDLDWFAERIRLSGHPDLDYVIWRDQIADPGRAWQDYGGRYHSHVHVSVGDGPDGRSTGGYDSTGPWGIASGASPSLPSRSRIAQPTLRYGDSEPEVGKLQRNLNEAINAGLSVDGRFGPATAAAVRELQRRAGITQDEIYGPDSARALKDLLEDDMDLDDKINLRWDGEVKYSAKTTTVGGILTSTNYYTLQARDRILTELASARKRDEAILAAVEGLDTEAVLARIDQRAAEDAQRDAELATLVEAAQSGRLEASAVVDELAKRLGLGE